MIFAIAWRSIYPPRHRFARRPSLQQVAKRVKNNKMLRMKTAGLLIAILILSCPVKVAAQENLDFEQGLKGWTTKGMQQILPSIKPNIITGTKAPG